MPLVLVAAQLAAREPPLEQHLFRTLLVWPVGFRLAPVSQSYFPLAAEWRALVSSSQPLANFVVQAQLVMRALGRLYLLREQRLARVLLR